MRELKVTKEQHQLIMENGIKTVISDVTDKQINDGIYLVTPDGIGGLYAEFEYESYKEIEKIAIKHGFVDVVSFLEYVVNEKLKEKV